MSQKKSPKMIKNLKAEIDSGEYFSASVKWYNEVFLMPIAQRNWMLIFAICASVAAFFALISMASILPVVEKRSIPMDVENSESYVADKVKLTKPGMTADQTILEFFVTEYLIRREEYSFHRYDKNRAFVEAHSDPITYSAYDSVYKRENPRSPAAVLGERGERIITIRDVQINRAISPPVATIKFDADIRARKSFPKTRWTASIAFYYDSLQVKEIKNLETGELSAQTVDPVFNVVQYVVSEDKQQP
jgi:type IV secretory pathway component VirB8